MKRSLLGLGVVAAMLFAASSAFAGGMNISWSTCFGEGTGTNNRTFACLSNAGTNLLVTSFILNADIVGVSGSESVLDVLSATDPIPLWWQFRDTGTCRQTALGSNAIADANNVTCVDWAQGQAAGGIGAYQSDPGAAGWTIDPSVTLGQHRRIKLAFAVPLAGLQDLTAGPEYFSANISINNTKTVGTGACSGCNQPVCIVFNSIKVVTNSGVGNVVLENAASAGSNIVTWQGVGPNCQLVPTKNLTWGSVKALYR